MVLYIRNPFAVIMPALFLAGCPGTGTNTPPPIGASPRATPVPVGRSFAPLVGGGKGVIDGLGGSARLDEPSGIDVDAIGRLFIVETGGHRVRRITSDGRTDTITGGAKGWRDGSVAEARFSAPAGVAVARDGRLIVADSGNHRIRVVAPDGTVSTLAGDGTAGFADGQAASAHFHSPLGVAVTALDEVVVADTGNHRIRLIDRAGQVRTVAGGKPGYIDGDADGARFNGPADVAIDARGQVFVADLRNHTIRVLDLVERQVRTLAGSGTEGDADGPAITTRFRLPSGLAISPTGEVLVADAGNRLVRRVAVNGHTSTVAWFEGAGIVDVASGPDGALYVTDTAGHQVLQSQ